MTAQLRTCVILAAFSFFGCARAEQATAPASGTGSAPAASQAAAAAATAAAPTADEQYEQEKIRRAMLEDLAKKDPPRDRKPVEPPSTVNQPVRMQVEPAREPDGVAKHLAEFASSGSVDFLNAMCFAPINRMPAADRACNMRNDSQEFAAFGREFSPFALAEKPSPDVDPTIAYVPIFAGAARKPVRVVARLHEDRWYLLDIIDGH